MVGHVRLTKLGLARVKAEGRMISGKPAYGWRCIEPGSTVLEEDPAEQKAIVQARALRRAGLSLRAIAETLAEGGHRGRTGKTLTASSIQSMIADDAPLNMRMIGKTFRATILAAVGGDPDTGPVNES